MPNRYYIPDNGQSENLVALIQTLARLIRTATAQELRQLGLYPGQDAVINMLADGVTMTPGELAQALGVRPPTITKTLSRLEEQGFLRRTADEADARKVVVTLTESGNAVVKKMRKAVKRVEKQALSNLKKKDRKLVISLLQMVRQDLENAPSA